VTSRRNPDNLRFVLAFELSPTQLKTRLAHPTASKSASQPGDEGKDENDERNDDSPARPKRKERLLLAEQTFTVLRYRLYGIVQQSTMRRGHRSVFAKQRPLWNESNQSITCRLCGNNALLGSINKADPAITHPHRDQGEPHGIFPSYLPTDTGAIRPVGATSFINDERRSWYYLDPPSRPPSSSYA
jgi:hypothetical protein